jgi:hypothetical protein
MLEMIKLTKSLKFKKYVKKYTYQPTGMVGEHGDLQLQKIHKFRPVL